ncbi:MAG: hypothetical protein QOJ50_248 [Cryptosporangiaceae bacterium]|nr:hypothetical protein [Cryptosporangiaceae bacterium]
MDRRSGMTALRRSLYAAPLAAVIIVGGAGISGAAQAPANPTVPKELKVPAGNVLSSSFQAHGVQIYQCTAGKWVFLEPAASLTGKTVAGNGGTLDVLHFRGPSWESVQDGSLVEGTLAASVPSPTPGTIPQLLVRATKTQGNGLLGHVTFVQRIATKGGAAPAGSCAGTRVLSVKYTAVYRFYNAGS